MRDLVPPVRGAHAVLEQEGAPYSLLHSVKSCCTRYGARVDSVASRTFKRLAARVCRDATAVGERRAAGIPMACVTIARSSLQAD